MNTQADPDNLIAIRTANETEAVLIDLVKQGDMGAYRRLYDLYVGKVYPLCLRLTADESLAEDAVQEVFVQVWKNIRHYRGDSKFSTWLYSMTSNVTISQIRKQTSWWRKLIDIEDEKLPEIPNGGQVHQQQEQGERLEISIRRLPEKARIVFVLYAVQGYRHEDIAHITGMAVGSSKAQLHRAKQLLKEWMSDE